MARLAITNMSKGEFGPQLYGRIDVPQYSAGVKEGRNFLIQRYGGMIFRPGFRFAAEVDDPSDTYRLLQFQYSIEQAYVLVLGDSKMRVVAEGGFVVEDDLQIVSVVQGTTTTLEIPFHGYAAGERIYIDGVEGMVELNNRFATVLSVPDANHIVIALNSTEFSAFTSSSGDVRTVAPDPAPVPEPPPTAPPPTTKPPKTTSTGSDLGTYTKKNWGPGTWDAELTGSI